MKTNRLYVLGFATLMALVLAVPGESVRAQSMQDLEQELQKIARDLAERFREASAQWQQTLRRAGSADKDDPVAFMLQHKDGLELSSQQIQDLKKLRSGLERESIRREADIKVARMELDELMEADSVDLEKAEEKVRQVERLRADEKLSQIRILADARAVLRPDQRKKFAVLRAANNPN